MATLYIIRGLPGSGKSTLARRLVHESRHREADMFFMKNGEYKFDARLLKDAHNWCFDEVQNLVSLEQSDVVVSNTFTKRWEYTSYLKLAKQHGYDVMVIDCHADFANVHDVPQDAIEKMRNRWQPYC